MKTWKLVAGILSMVLFMVVVFQSCAVGVSNALESSSDVSGSTGILVAILMLTGGIVSVVTRKSDSRGGNIALIVLFGLAALFGFTDNGKFTDLVVWASWCLINAVIALIAFIKAKRVSVEPNVDDK